MAAAGHLNVFYIGDRVKRPGVTLSLGLSPGSFVSVHQRFVSFTLFRPAGQLNGKSANLNHAIMHKVYPEAQRPEDIPSTDMIMVMDVDHLVKPDIFNRMGPCMMDEEVAVTLVPQRFHNTLLPDAFDFANAHFMFTILPYYFGAGTCFITGATVPVARCLCS
jgi:cellulose synthase/poly-beta-1,6-N-acetylglucosamine synthase-like glycosyltransferase